jgi:lantibiotic transport system permease protein
MVHFRNQSQFLHYTNKQATMDENDFREQMENLRKPEVNAEASRKQIKLTLMNTKKSAFWGIWFIVVPVFFLICVVIKELLRIDLGISNTFIEWMAKLDHSPSTKWLTPLLFVLLPGVGAVVNLLAIMHFVYDRMIKELVVTVRLRWLNIILAAISLALLSMVILYGITENAHHRAIQQMEDELQLKK